MRSLPACDLAWIEQAPTVIKVSIHLSAPPDRVFAAFADAAGWPRWFPTMTDSRWLDDSGGGLGKERVVSLRSLGRFHERFIAWEEPHRFAFTVIGTTSSDGSGSRFDWTMGSKPRGLGTIGTPILRMVASKILRRAVANLDRQLAAA
jgi:uncharacterized protein YndB with AHSA1/START domain